MALTKTSGTLYTMASTASNTCDEGSAVDCSTWYSAKIRIRMGRGTGTAFTQAPRIRLQWTEKTSVSGFSDWIDEQVFIPAVGASIASQNYSSGGAAGASTVVLAGNTNFAATDYVFFHQSTLANSEWARVQSISSNTLTLTENLVNAMVSGMVCRDQAEEWTYDIDLASANKIRLVVDGANSGQAVIVQALYGAVTGL